MNKEKIDRVLESTKVKLLNSIGLAQAVELICEDNPAIKTIINYSMVENWEREVDKLISEIEGVKGKAKFD